MSQGENYHERKIINWPEYNRALVKRGSVTFWIGEDATSVWYHDREDKTGRGLHKTFSDTALQLCLMLSMRTNRITNRLQAYHPNEWIFTSAH